MQIVSGLPVLLVIADFGHKAAALSIIVVALLDVSSCLRVDNLEICHVNGAVTSLCKVVGKYMHILYSFPVQMYKRASPSIF